MKDLGSCPKCQEPLDPEPGTRIESCPHCGAEVAPRGASGRLVVAGMAVLFVLVLLVTVVGALVVPTFVSAREKASRTKCLGNLRQIGISALQYAEDAGAFPHVRGEAELDGDPRTADTPRAFRLLRRAGYLDGGLESLLCPSAPRTRPDPAARAGWSRWFKSDGSESADVPAPSLAEMDDLSYGWTRRYLPGSAPSTTLVAADKATLARWGPNEEFPGNHVGGWNVMAVDAAVTWLSVDDEPFPGAWLAKCEDPQRDGFLCVKDQDDREVLRKKR